MRVERFAKISEIPALLTQPDGGSQQGSCSPATNPHTPVSLLLLPPVGRHRPPNRRSARPPAIPRPTSTRNPASSRQHHRSRCSTRIVPSVLGRISLRPPVHRSYIRPSVRPSIHLPDRSSVRPSERPFVRSSVRPSVVRPAVAFGRRSYLSHASPDGL